MSWVSRAATTPVSRGVSWTVTSLPSTTIQSGPSRFSGNAEYT
jgi:hypothetical protein